jgi:hypothetical protein
MPRPKAVYGRRLWEVRAVDIAFDLLDGGYTTKMGEGEVYEFAMKYRKPKHVIEDKGPDGQYRFYFRRRKGQKKVRLVKLPTVLLTALRSSSGASVSRPLIFG